jgi:hypothetical protein
MYSQRYTHRIGQHEKHLLTDCIDTDLILIEGALETAVSWAGR